MNEENRRGLYVALPCYFIALAVVAVLSNRWLRRLEKSEKSDAITGHYLGGRSFGPILMAGTIFATQFSGYTVIGIPNEAYRAGFYSFRWIATFPYVFLGFFGTGVRLRKAGLVRNHATPIDFITDRFRSQLLRYTILLIQVLASLVYLAAQVNALQSTFNSMFGFDPSDAWPVVVIMIIILGIEFAGGLAVVAMSDCIQGIVMVVSFFCLPLVILKNYGGWSSLDPLTYPKPEFYQTPSSNQQWLFWQWSIVNFSFFVLPHFMQRIYAAKDLESLRLGFTVQTMAPWLASFTGVFLGTIGVQMLADAGQENPPSPFTAIIDIVLDYGGFAKGIGIIALIASLAGIMSTADSLIIALSQLITVEIYWPFRSHASQKELSLFGKFASTVSVAIALVIGILWKEGLSALSAINFPINMQAVPAYINGLYASDKRLLHPWSLAYGALVALVYVFSFYFSYMHANPSSLPINVGIVGVLINCASAILFDVLIFDRSKLKRLMKKEKVGGANDTEEHVTMSNRPKWDYPSHDRFGEVALTSSLLNRMMDGFPEPLTSFSFNAFFFVAVTMITPLLAEGQPVISSETGQFVSNPPTVRGIPWWLLKQIVISVIPYLAVLKILYDMPTEYPFDDKKIDEEGIDPNLLELTAKEMNFRGSFDGINQSITKRRSTIASKMEALGLNPQDQTLKDSITKNIPQSSRLSTIIKEKIDLS